MRSPHIAPARPEDGVVLRTMPVSLRLKCSRRNYRTMPHYGINVGWDVEEGACHPKVPWKDGK